MPLPSGQYILGCWSSTQNPQTSKRSRLLFQCHKLIKALRAKLTSNQIVVPSRDAKESNKGIEICVMYLAGTGSSFANVKDVLNEEAAKLSLDYMNYVEEDESLTRYFNDVEMGNLEDLSKPIAHELTEKDFEDLDKAMNEFTGFQVSDTWSKAVPKEKQTEPLLLTRRTLARLRKSEKDELRKEITGYMDSLNAMSKAPKTAWQTIAMIGGGVIAAGRYLAKLSGAWAAIGVTVELVSFVACAIGVAATAAIVGVLIVIFGALVGGLYLVFKGAQNILLAVNNSLSDVWPVDHYTHSGVITSGASYLPASPEGSPTAWAGWYIYDRKIGFYGTTFALTFHRNGEDVTVGMDCPNSFFGGRNSVCVLQGNDKQAVVKKVDDTHDKDSMVQMSSGNTVARIVSKYGNVNWGYVVFDGK